MTVIIDGESPQNTNYLLGDEHYLRHDQAFNAPKQTCKYSGFSQGKQNLYALVDVNLKTFVSAYGEMITFAGRSVCSST